MDKQDLKKCLTFKRESESPPDFTTIKLMAFFADSHNALVGRRQIGLS